jgi:two-component system, OmpR family, sensor histidine kinase KdpD
MNTPLPDDPTRVPWRHWAAVVLSLAGATLAATWLDGEVSLTSQAMLYLLVVVVVSHRLGWRESVVCAVAAVTTFNFFFVPPRWTLAVEHHEHFIALAVMLVVGLTVARLANGLRRESQLAQLNARRAQQLQTLAAEITGADTAAALLQLGRAALLQEFAEVAIVVLTGDGSELADPADLPRDQHEGLRSCMHEQAVLGPGTGRWPGLEAWFLPLGGPGRVAGAARVAPALAADAPAREHAHALCALLGEGLWRLRLAASMQVAQAQAQRQQLQGTLLAAVSHDLRTPLAAIVGAASALRVQGDRLSGAEQDRLLGSIESEAAYLSAVTENTLHLVRLAEGHATLRRDWESLEEVVGTVLQRVRQRDPSRRIQSRVAPDLPLVRADPVLLAQLLGNLLDNALKYSSGDVHLVVEQSANELLVTVKDHGPGVAEPDLATLFEPFVRGTQTQGQRGAGLGLAVCRAIAQVHGGTLTVRRRSGGGASFCLALPIDAEQPHGDSP